MVYFMAVMVTYTLRKEMFCRVIATGYLVFSICTDRLSFVLLAV